MTILLIGGGTGGHITPLLAVAKELKRANGARFSSQTAPSTAGSHEVRVIYVGDRGNKFENLVRDCEDIDKVYSVHAGKFRRYHGESWLVRIFDVRTNFLNLRDVFRLLIGICESIRLIRKVKPDAVLSKGGMVAVPVGFAAHLEHVPIVTHDSDAIPGLGNRIIARWAAIHATGALPDKYTYPKEKTHYVGVPIPADFKFVDSKLKQQYRGELGISHDAQVLLIEGGSSGAQVINEYMLKIADSLKEKLPELVIFHQTGKGKAVDYGPGHEYIRKFGFVDDIWKYSGAADVVVTRSGATAMAGLVEQGKACVIIPSPHLAGGHALKNAEYYLQHKAGVILQEKDLNKNPVVLAEAIVDLFKNPSRKAELAANLHKLSKPNAAASLVDLLLKGIKDRSA